MMGINTSLIHIVERNMLGEKNKKNLAICSVLDCVTEITDWSNKKVYFNNWFSSFLLIKVLSENGVCATWNHYS